MRRQVLALVVALAFVGTVLAANLTLEHLGVLSIGGLLVPSGVLWAGLAFSLRDAVHELAGRWGVLLAIAAGAVLSFGLGAQFAVASAVAFLVSEIADFLVYSPLRRRNRIGAVLVSGMVGLVVDSLLFLQLAFGGLGFLAGQIIGKAAVLMLTVAGLAVCVPDRRLVIHDE